jgi:hypothetical protein
VRRSLRRALALSGCVALAATSLSCSTLVDVDEYAFDESPCGPRPPACEPGGAERVYAIQWVDIPRLDSEGRRDGFDLDGTEDAICNARDFVAPDGRRGIDQQMAGLLEVLENASGQNTRVDSGAAAARGEDVGLIVISGLDDEENDPCVEVTQRSAYLPAGTTVESLDRERDNLLDENVTFDYGTARERDPVACIVDGTLYARFPPTTRVSPVGGGEVTAYRGRMRMGIAGEGAQSGLFGGSLHVDELPMIDETALRVLRQAADLEPSARGVSDCQGISFALIMQAVPARLGALRSTP